MFAWSALWECSLIAKVLFPAIIAAVLIGCGKSGPERYEVSGAVTYHGRPVRGGRILFTPDTTQGNNGPGSVAEISNGMYYTRQGK